LTSNDKTFVPSLVKISQTLGSLSEKPRSLLANKINKEALWIYIYIYIYKYTIPPFTLYKGQNIHPRNGFSALLGNNRPRTGLKKDKK